MTIDFKITAETATRYIEEARFALLTNSVEYRHDHLVDELLGEMQAAGIHTKTAGSLRRRFSPESIIETRAHNAAIRAYAKEFVDVAFDQAKLIQIDRSKKDLISLKKNRMENAAAEIKKIMSEQFGEQFNKTFYVDEFDKLVKDYDAEISGENVQDIDYARTMLKSHIIDTLNELPVSKAQDIWDQVIDLIKKL